MPTKQEELTIRFLQELVRCPSYTGSEMQAAIAVEKMMKNLDYDEVMRDPFGSVVGRINGKLPGPVILFDAHIDEVDVGNLTDWTHDPFSGDNDDGKIWGRGSSDNKGSLAAMVVGIGTLQREKIKGTIFVSATIGEEKLEGASLGKVIDLIHPDMVVIGEPTDCRIGNGQKGRAGILIKTFGKPAHSANPELGDNAVYRASEVIRRLQVLPKRSDIGLGQAVLELVDIISKPYPSGSTVPFECSMRYDYRLISGDTKASIISEITQALRGLEKWEADYMAVRIDTYTGNLIQEADFHPAWLMSLDSPIVKMSLAALEKAGIDPVHYIIPYCSNGSTSAGEKDIPTIVFGPSTIHMAHSLNEHIEINELLKAMRGYQSLAIDLGID